MRHWWIAAGALLALYVAADGLASSWTLSDLYARPVSLVREADGGRVSVWLPTTPDAVQPEGTARLGGATGIPLGDSHSFSLPGGGPPVRCRHLVRWIWCDGGWRAERG